MLSANLDFSFGPGEQNARHVSADLVARHGHAVCIFIGQHFIDFAVGRNDFDRPAVVGSQRPLGDIEHMRAPVSHLAAGVVAIRHPPLRRNP